jgi:hypothetical protein
MPPSFSPLWLLELLPWGQLPSPWLAMASFPSQLTFDMMFSM